VKYAFIERERVHYPVKLQCRVLEISEQGFYGWRKCRKDLKAKRRSKLVAEIHRIFVTHKKRYGSPRVYQELKKRGVHCSENRVARLMREEGLRAKGKRKYRVTTDSWRSALKRVAPNLLMRQFKVMGPNQVWCGDITYVWTDEGYMYLSVFLDLYSRKIVGWSLDDRLHTPVVTRSLNQALMIRQPGKGLLIHTDRGSQYTSDAFLELAESSKLTLSMSRKGNCWDNAVAESFFGNLKRES